MREMGRLVAGLSKTDLAAGFATYQQLLGQALHRLPRLQAHTNVLQHAFGYFSEELTSSERAHFLRLIDRFHEGKIPLGSLVEVVRAWLVRHPVQYLLNQVYFDPFPQELLSLDDSGKGRI